MTSVKTKKTSLNQTMTSQTEGNRTFPQISNLLPEVNSSNPDVLLMMSQKCREDFGVENLSYNETSYCPVVWDGLLCWNVTQADTLAIQHCPVYRGFDTDLYASKVCVRGGQWWESPVTNRSWTNYTTCINLSEFDSNLQVVKIYIIGYIISLILLIASLIIFIVYRRQLNCDRVRVHKHMFACSLANCVSWILYYSLVYSSIYGSTIFEDNSIWCRGLHVGSQYLSLCNNLWMFCEGFCLHTVIVFGFTSGKKLLMASYLTGWVFPIFPTVLYVILRAFSGKTQSCWYVTSAYTLIIECIIIVTIVANVGFLLNILRVLVTKLRAVNSPDVCQLKKALKATVILVPLLGIQFVLFPRKPSQKHMLRMSYDVALALVSSLQGFFLAMIFCFLNGEVINLIKRKYHANCQQHFHRRQSSFPPSNLATLVTYPMSEINPKQTKPTQNDPLSVQGKYTPIELNPGTVGGGESEGLFGSNGENGGGDHGGSN